MATIEFSPDAERGMLLHGILPEFPVHSVADEALGLSITTSNIFIEFYDLKLKTADKELESTWPADDHNV